MNSTLLDLIRQTKGKFFTLKFRKLDGSERVVNGKNLYKRLIAGGDSTVAHKGYVSIIDRNKGESGAWIAAHDERLIEFKCGALHRKF